MERKKQFNLAHCLSLPAALSQSAFSGLNAQEEAVRMILNQGDWFSDP